MTRSLAHIRDASRDDAPAIAAVLREAWRELATQAGWTREQLPRSPAFCQPEWITEGMDRGGRYFVAECATGSTGREGGTDTTGGGTAAIGCVGMGRPMDGASELIRLGVVPASRRGGLGATLVEHVVGEARSLGLARVDLALIAERTELQQWYEKLGFVLTRVEANPRLPFKVAHMSLDLPREVTGRERTS